MTTKGFVWLIAALVIFSIVVYFAGPPNTYVYRPPRQSVAIESANSTPHITPLPSMVFFHCPECVEERIRINLFKTSQLNEIECSFSPTFRHAGKIVARSGEVVKVEFPNRCAGWISTRLLRGPGLPRR